MATLNQLRTRLDMLESRVPGLAHRSVGMDEFWSDFELYTDNILIDAAGHRDYVRRRLDAMRMMASAHLMEGTSTARRVQAAASGAPQANGR